MVEGSPRRTLPRQGAYPLVQRPQGRNRISAPANHKQHDFSGLFCRCKRSTCEPDSLCASAETVSVLLEKCRSTAYNRGFVECRFEWEDAMGKGGKVCDIQSRRGEWRGESKKREVVVTSKIRVNDTKVYINIDRVQGGSRNGNIQQSWASFVFRNYELLIAELGANYGGNDVEE